MTPNEIDFLKNINTTLNGLVRSIDELRKVVDSLIVEKEEKPETVKQAIEEVANKEVTKSNKDNKKLSE